MEPLNFLHLWKPSSAGDTTIRHHLSLSDSDDESFFDLELNVPNSNTKNSNNDNNNNDLFYNARIQPLDSDSKPQSPIALFKSSPKLRIFMFGFRKSTSETKNDVTKSPKHQNLKQQKKLFAINFEEVPMISIFNRNNSSRSSDESSKRFPKNVIRKYLRLIKPLYVKVSRRNGEKMRFSGESTTPLASPVKTPMRKGEAEEKLGSFPAGFRVVCKHLGKSRSASSTAVSVGFSPPVNRRDDSLLLQHDGIQGAILHCKRSFNSSKDTNVLSRSTSHNSKDKAAVIGRTWDEEEKDKLI